jgi:hypothetical protein
MYRKDKNTNAVLYWHEKYLITKMVYIVHNMQIKIKNWV